MCVVSYSSTLLAKLADGHWRTHQAMAMAIPSEVTAAQIILTYWDVSPKHAAMYTAAICLGVCAVNTLGVRWFGEGKLVCS